MQKEIPEGTILFGARVGACEGTVTQVLTDISFVSDNVKS